MYKYRVSEDNSRFVMKMYNNENNFIKSVIIPTVYYPLNGILSVFNSHNTAPIQDNELIKLIDTVPFTLGKCFNNTNVALKLLTEKGYDVTPYCGWLFVNGNIPVYHSWLVYNNSIIDISDNKYIYDSSHTNAYSDNLKKEGETYFFKLMKKTMTLKNSQRCYPIGKASDILVYVGCERLPLEGKIEYSKLIEDFPNHESYKNVGVDNSNRTQRILKNI